jgi:hypothetical protein
MYLAVLVVMALSRFPLKIWPDATVWANLDFAFPVVHIPEQHPDLLSTGGKVCRLGNIGELYY